MNVSCPRGRPPSRTGGTAAGLGGCPARPSEPVDPHPASSAHTAPSAPAEISHAAWRTSRVSFRFRSREAPPARRRWPNRRYSDGSTNRLSSVDVNSPPRMTTASGCSISCPGRVPSTTSGTSASPVASDVIRIGASRSRAPRSTSSRPNAIPSCSSRCWQWLISRIPLRAAMPNTVKKPTSEPSEMIPPAIQAASTPPTSAIGNVRNSEHGEPPVAERGLEQQQDEQPGDDRRLEQPALRRLPLLVLAQQLDVVPAGQCAPDPASA